MRHRQREEADQDVRLHAIFLVVKHRPQAQVAFGANGDSYSSPLFRAHYLIV